MSLSSTVSRLGQSYCTKEGGPGAVHDGDSCVGNQCEYIRGRAEDVTSTTPTRLLSETRQSNYSVPISKVSRRIMHITDFRRVARTFYRAIASFLRNLTKEKRDSVRDTARHRNQEEASQGYAQPCVKLNEFLGRAGLCSDNDESVMRFEAHGIKQPTTSLPSEKVATATVTPH